jgi:hypothetical protein
MLSRMYLEEVNARLRVALESTETEKDQLTQRIKSLEEQFRHDKQQFEVRAAASVLQRFPRADPPLFSILSAVSNIGVVGTGKLGA